MSQSPLTYLERKWASGRTGANRLIDAATQNSDRKRITNNDYDFHRNISTAGRRTLATLGNWLFWNCDPVRGAVLEAANYATETWVAQFEGEDQSWGEEAENWLVENNKFCNIRSGRTYENYIHGLVISTFTAGELYTVLAERDGIPKIQVFPSHRVGCRNQSTAEVIDGPYKGRAVLDGAIVDEFANPLAYQIFTDDNNMGPLSPHVDVSVNDVIPSFIPYFDEQLRGISLLGASMFNLQGARDWRDLSMIQQQLAATVGLIEQNETGEVDSAKAVIGPGTHNATTKVQETVATQKVEGVSIHRYRAGMGFGLEALKNDKPTDNQREFVDASIREALAGVGWSWDFSLNPTKAGGRAMYLVVEKINRNIAALKKYILLPTCRRIDGWRISKAIKNGWLKPNDEWYKWSYQGAAEISADRKHDSDVDIAERRSGITTLKMATAKRGQYWRDVRPQQEMEIVDALTRSKRIAEQFGIPIETALALFDTVTPNANLPQGQPEPEPADDKEE